MFLKMNQALFSKIARECHYYLKIREIIQIKIKDLHHLEDRLKISNAHCPHQLTKEIHHQKNLILM